MLAGVRTAAVQIVATEPLGAFFGGEGLGAYLRQGLATRDVYQVQAGALLVTGVAIGRRAALVLAARLLVPERHPRRPRPPVAPAPLARTGRPRPWHDARPILAQTNPHHPKDTAMTTTRWRAPLALALALVSRRRRRRLRRRRRAHRPRRHVRSRRRPDDPHRPAGLRRGEDPHRGVRPVPRGRGLRRRPPGAPTASGTRCTRPSRTTSST